MRIFMKRAAIGVAVAALLATALPAAVFAAGPEPNVVSVTPIGPASLDFGSFPYSFQAFSTASDDNAGHIYRLDVFSNTPSVCDVTNVTYVVADPARVNFDVQAFRPGWCAIWVRDPGNLKFQAAPGIRTIAITAPADTQLVVTADDQTKMYGTPSDPIGFTVAGLLGNDTPANAFATLPVCTTARSTFSPVGSYPGANTCTAGVPNEFYGGLAAQGTPVAGTFTVIAATAPVVTARSYDLTYGDAVPAVGFTVTGLYPGDNFSTNPTCTTTYTPTSAVSPPTYPTTCSGGVLSANYEKPTYLPGVITVGKATATITADNKTTTYLDPIPALTWTSVPVVAFADITCTTTATAASLPGSYPITCRQPLKVPSPNSNYTITFKAGTLTIGKGSQTIKVNAYSGRIGTFAPLYGLSSVGLPVAFTSMTPATCRTFGAYGTRVYFSGLGRCEILATQGGSGTWLPAPSQTLKLWVTRD